MENKPDNIDALLSEIQSVEAPEFLLTRIHAQLNTSEQDTISVKWATLSATFLGLLLVLNFWVVQQTNTSNEATLVMEQMQLISNNNFYNN